MLLELRATGFPRSDGKPGRAWGARSVNLMVTVIRTVLESAMRQGMVHRNVAALVDRLPSTQQEMDTFTAAEVVTVLAAAEGDRNGHAWHLALSGLRRGELSGLRWSDIDFGGETLTIANTRVSIDGRVDEKAPKTPRSQRTLPLTLGLIEVLRRAQRRQLEERLAFGPEYTQSGYVVVDEAGRPYHPETISDYWDRLLAGANVRRIRLHDARHTCGTLMHLQGVPVAVISAWLGHADAAFTMRTYVHSQDDALVAAAAVLGDLMSPASRAV